MRQLFWSDGNVQEKNKDTPPNPNKKAKGGALTYLLPGTGPAGQLLLARADVSQQAALCFACVLPLQAPEPLAILFPRVPLGSPGG